MTTVYQKIAKLILKYLEDSEALKVSTRELQEQVLSPNEPSVDKVRIARQARSRKSKKLFQIFSRQGANEIFVASLARWEEELEHLNEKQEVLATLIEGKMSMQKVAPGKYQEKIFEELKEKTRG